MSCYSELECKIIMDQIKRRKKFREEFLKKRTDPHQHAIEAGYVFDSAIQRFLSMKACQYELFNANPRTAIAGVVMVVLPMLAFGALVYNWRSQFEADCRSGRLRYRDRINKLI